MEENITQKVRDISLEDAQGDDDNIEWYNLASYLGQSILRPEHKASLMEILRCAVCLEVPPIRAGLQIRCCKYGHHFCTTCHTKLKTCAICRASLENGRNFVVEEIINKLGRELGFAKAICVEPSQPPTWPKGRFKCPHLCGGSFTAIKILPHIRDRHRVCLKDNLRTNPYTKWFQHNMNIPFSPGRKVLSFHVSEMGVLTLGIIFPELGSNSPLRVWIQAVNKSNFTYQVLFTTASNQFFGVTDQSVLDYVEANDIEKYAKIATQYAFTLEEELEFSIVVHGTMGTQPDRMMRGFLWKVPADFMNDRRCRRTNTRNRRRNNLRARIRRLNASTSTPPIVL